MRFDQWFLKARKFEHKKLFGYHRTTDSLQPIESDSAQTVRQSHETAIQLMATLCDVQEQLSEKSRQATAACELAADLKKQVMTANDRESDLQRQLEHMKLLQNDQEKQNKLIQHLYEMKRSMSEKRGNLKMINELRGQLSRSTEVEKRLRLDLKQTTGLKDELKRQLALNNELRLQLGAVSARVDELETLLKAAKQKETELTELGLLNHKSVGDYRSSFGVPDISDDDVIRWSTLTDDVTHSHAQTTGLATHTSRVADDLTGFSKIIHGKRDLLARKIHLSTRLWNLLLDKGVLTDHQVESCQNKETDYDRATTMINMLEQKPKALIEKFCEVLKATGQDYIVNHFLVEQA